MAKRRTKIPDDWREVEPSFIEIVEQKPAMKAHHRGLNCHRCSYGELAPCPMNEEEICRRLFADGSGA